jgi:Leucine rich repeat
MNPVSRFRWTVGLVACAFTAMCMGCIGDAAVADGGGTETGNGTVQGLAAYANGTPALNALVRIRQEGYSALTSDPASQGKWDVRTDADGRFKIKGLRTGSFVAEFQDGAGQAAMATFRLETDSAHALVIGDLHSAAAVSGRLLLPGGASAPGQVSVYGLDHWTATDSVGRFVLPNLPEGRHTLHFKPQQPTSGEMDLPKVLLAAGEERALGEFELPPKTCLDLACDTAQVRAVLVEAALSGLAWGDVSVTGVDGKGKLRIVELHLAKRGLTRLPEGIGQLSALRKLDVSDNKISQLPLSIGHLRVLRSLNLYRNQITELPAAIGQLSGLTALNVRSNQLTVLPAAMGRLFGLELFDAQENELMDLPSTLVTLGPLALALEGNPLCLLSPDLLEWVKRNDPAFSSQVRNCP